MAEREVTELSDYDRGVIHGWELAARHLEEYHYPHFPEAAVKEFVREMRTRFPEVARELFVVTQGQAYEFEYPTGVFDSLKRARDQFPVNTQWEVRGSEDVDWTASLGTFSFACIYRLMLNKPLED